MNLQNKTVIITGASQGIGASIALAFAKEGANIILCYRQNEQGAVKALDNIQKLSSKSIKFGGDLSEEKVVKDLFDLVKKEFGSVDILINNAGKSVPKDITQTNKEDWIKAFNDNFFNTVLCSKYALEQMIHQKSGKIINMASINGLEHVGRPGNIAYSAAKAAISNFTKTLAKAYAPNILINAVAPGATMTDYWSNVDPEFKTRAESDFPIKRFIKPEEIAEVFVFIAKNDALTGSLIVADGGFSLKEYN